MRECLGQSTVPPSPPRSACDPSRPRAPPPSRSCPSLPLTWPSPGLAPVISTGGQEPSSACLRHSVTAPGKALLSQTRCSEPAGLGRAVSAAAAQLTSAWAAGPGVGVETGLLVVCLCSGEVSCACQLWEDLGRGWPYSKGETRPHINTPGRQEASENLRHEGRFLRS